MNAGATAGAAAAAAAAEAARQEEEEMTHYTGGDLQDDWEFKILRSGMGAFRNPKTLQRVLEEEAQAGWTLVEKFDNERIRLKRPGIASKNDARLDFDAYRTHVGHGEATVVMLVLGILIAVAVAGFVVVNL